MKKHMAAKRGLKDNSCHPALAIAITTALVMGPVAHAQEAEGATAQSEAEDNSPRMMSTVYVSAQKKTKSEQAQDVPIAVSAFSEGQLDALNYRNLEDIKSLVPNVTLDANGNSRTHANFTIRGLGANSSIVTIEPAVGVFVNGVYQGIPAGNVLDSYDLSNVQVLRGPQGTLFGRNVTGGAILLETRRPSGKKGGEVKASYETGPEYSVAGAFETPLVENVADLRVAAYYKKDEGWFTNEFDGSDFGKEETWLIRPTLVLHLADNVEQTFILEYGKSEGDGPPEQGLNLVGVGDGFQLNMDEPGIAQSEWTAFTSETNVNVSFGDGVVTNVFGYKKYDGLGLSDIDATPLPLFHSWGSVDQEQFSNELRYAGTFGGLDLTTGVFYFTQDIFLAEERNPFVAGRQGGGGRQDHSSYGVFAQGTYALNDQWNLTGGLRYSHEEKDAVVIRRQPGGCTVEPARCNFALAQLDDSDSWNSVSPKIGVEYRPNEDIMFYGSYAEAVRSGGFNLRLAAPLDPGTFDQENVSTYEIGTKGDYLDGRVRANLAAFYSEFDNLQRTVNAVIPGTGNIVQTLTNGANAESRGIEGDFIIAPTEGVEILANFGYTDMEYTEVFFDLNGDGVVDGTDLDLKTPRVSPWSYGFGLLGWHDFSNGGELRGQIFYSYRDEQAATDSNDLFYPDREDVKVNITYLFPNERFEVSLYGRNLTDEVPDNGAKLRVPSFPSGGFRSIGEGRSVGVSGRLKF